MEPYDLLRPFEPTDEKPWDAAAAAHLARRAGFGATREEVLELVALGPEAAVARFVDYPEVDEALEAEIAQLGGELTSGAGSAGQQVARVRDRWMYRIVRGSSPLQEKLTLLWHDHFACQESKVLRSALIERQNELLRSHAGGSFRDLLRGVARDPAMLVYLDNRLSTKANPNENWARELLELFTLGLDQYRQEDVVALARIFTGWTTPAPHEAVFEFRPGLHDPGGKVLFSAKLEGRSGAAGIEEGDAALERILARPACATFIASVLLGWFANHEPDARVAAALGAVLREKDWNIRETLRVLFRSTWFLAPENRLTRVKNPIELVAATARRLDMQNPHLARLSQHAANLGMKLFEPPDVAGWNHGLAWIDSGTTLRRQDLALELSELPHTTRRVTGRAACNYDRIAGTSNAAQAHAAVVALSLLDRSLPGQKVGLIAGTFSEIEPEFATRAAHRRRTRVAVHLVLATPEALSG